MKGNKNMRGHPGGQNRHLRGKKGNSGAFGSGGSNSSNWRESAKSNTNDFTTNGYNNHHLTSAFISLVGLYVEVQKTDGLIYEGILECVSSKLEIHLCHACLKIVDDEKRENGSLASESKGTLIFQFCDVVRCNAKNVNLDFAKREQLMTDTAISGGTGVIVERQLEKWQAGESDPTFEDIELESTDHKRWDFDEMIQQNKENHGYESTFDDSMSNYMTPLETCDEETYRKREQEAERIAREMQKDARHKELENVDSGAGEEELFSSVSRSTSNTSFTGPIRNTKSGTRGRGGPQGPRFQKVRNQDDVSHSRGSQNQRISNGLPPRHTQQQQHSQQSVHHQHIADASNKTNISNTENQALKSYSSVARKQPNVSTTINLNITNNTNENISQRPINRLPPVSSGDLINTGSYQNRELPKQEQLNKAKQQYIVEANELKRNSALVTTRSNINPSQEPPVPSDAIKTNIQEMKNVVSPSNSVSTLHQQPVISQSTDILKETPYNRMAVGGKPELKNSAISELTKPLRGAGELQKFGKVQKIHNEKKVEGDVSIEKLKEFKDIVINFEKPETSSTAAQPSKYENAVASKATTSNTSAGLGTFVSQSNTAVNDNVRVAKTTKPVSSTSAFSPSTATIMTTSTTSTMATSTSNSPVSTSTLNPATKEFNLNPSAKEFKPTFAKAKPTTDYVVSSPPYIGQQQGAPVIINGNQHQSPHAPQEIMQHQQPQFVQMRSQSMVSYRQPYPTGATVYEVPNSAPILNNPPHHNSYMPQQMYALNSNNPQYHQQQMMNGQQGQPFVPMQPVHNPLSIRVINPVQQRIPSNNFSQEGGIPTSYILHNAGAATPHSVSNTHQSMTASHNYQPQVQTPSSPAPSIPPHQQYVINNQNPTYQPHMAMHSQGTTPHYQQRAVYSAPIVVVPNFHHPGGQPGMIHSFQQGN